MRTARKRRRFDRGERRREENLLKFRLIDERTLADRYNLRLTQIRHLAVTAPTEQLPTPDFYLFHMPPC